MIANQVEKIMRSAIKRFSENDNVKCNNVQIMIHTRNDELNAEYFSMINGVPKVDENGEIEPLDFNKDILNTKMDFLQREHLANSFLKNYFLETSKEFSIEPKNIYFMIHSKDTEAKDIGVTLFDTNNKVKDLTLNDMFDKDN